MQQKFVSIIIPAYKDWDRLSLCLKSLDEQSYPRHLFEIIVVNNYTADKVPKDYFLPDNCKVITEEKPGAYAARNAGIALAAGDVIGFTDSDCIADRDWIKNGVDFLESDDECDRIAGRINLYYHSKNLTEAELYEKIYAFNQDVYVSMDGTGVTGNLFAYTYVFESVGLFKEDLLSGGDYEWSIRARDAGFKIKYADNAIVNHPARRKISELIKKAKRVGGGQAGFGEPPSERKFKSVLKFIYDLRPPVKSIRLILKKGKDLKLIEKIQVFSIRYYLSIITAREKFMVSMGKPAERN